MSAAASIPVIVLLLTFGSLIAKSQSSHVRNDRPIIGIVAQETSKYMTSKYDRMYDSYIAASYVKFIEGAGGRVVPIWVGQSNAYYERIMGKINGIAKRMNDNRNHFPIFGICLGFELLAAVTAKGKLNRTDCDSEDQTVHLNFTRNYTNSKLFGNAPSDVLDILKKENVTANFHEFFRSASICRTKFQDLRTANVTNKFRVLSLNHDKNGVEFISSMESETTPAEARKNRNKFESEEEASELIYNYPTRYTALDGSLFTQCYLFKVDKRKR